MFWVPAVLPGRGGAGDYRLADAARDLLPALEG